MTTSLDGLIAAHWDALVDDIAKDAICQIPSYHQAPIRVTMERVGRWLQTCADSIRENDPHLLERYLTGVGEERKEQGYAIHELHAIVSITEQHLRDLIDRSYADPVERSAQKSLLDAVLAGARMVLSVTFLLSMADKRS
jgi:hypothetical protein